MIIILCSLYATLNLCQTLRTFETMRFASLYTHFLTFILKVTCFNVAGWRKEDAGVLPWKARHPRPGCSPVSRRVSTVSWRRSSRRSPTPDRDTCRSPPARWATGAAFRSRCSQGLRNPSLRSSLSKQAHASTPLGGPALQCADMCFESSVSLAEKGECIKRSVKLLG